MIISMKNPEIMIDLRIFDVYILYPIALQRFPK